MIIIYLPSLPSDRQIKENIKYIIKEKKYSLPIQKDTLCSVREIGTYFRVVILGNRPKL